MEKAKITNPSIEIIGLIKIRLKNKKGNKIEKKDIKRINKDKIIPEILKSIEKLEEFWG